MFKNILKNKKIIFIFQSRLNFSLLFPLILFKFEFIHILKFGFWIKNWNVLCKKLLKKIRWLRCSDEFYLISLKTRNRQFEIHVKSRLPVKIKNVLKELCLCHRFYFSNSYIFATQCRRPYIFQTINLLDQIV